MTKASVTQVFYGKASTDLLILLSEIRKGDHSEIVIRRVEVFKAEKI
jgi:hypothetical protein